MTPFEPRLSVVIPTFNNLAILTRCFESWQKYAANQAVELIVIEDGCRDETARYLTEQAATPWGVRHLRWIHETNVHELRSTNRGIRESKAPIVMTWHDDMFLRVPWLVGELLDIFHRYPAIGLLCLSRGLTCTPFEEPIATWDDLIDWRRLQSTIGEAWINWFCLSEVDAVIRPWVIRRACIDRVGMPSIRHLCRPDGMKPISRFAFARPAGLLRPTDTSVSARFSISAAARSRIPR